MVDVAMISARLFDGYALGAVTCTPLVFLERTTAKSKAVALTKTLV